MPDGEPTLAEWLRARSAWAIAPLVLAAWFALLWFMFGDVL